MLTHHNYSYSMIRLQSITVLYSNSSWTQALSIIVLRRANSPNEPYGRVVTPVKRRRVMHDGTQMKTQTDSWTDRHARK